MEHIYLLHVHFFDDEQDNFIMAFSTMRKAQDFIVNNFKVRRLTDEFFEGETLNCIIEEMVLDQESF